MNDQPHLPVMLDEVLDQLAPRDGGVYLDATFGAGGYSRAILQAADCRLLAVDRDPGARPAAAAFAAEFGDRFIFLEGRFGEMEDLVRAAGVDALDGVVMDIGVSSMQIDQAERGFSFMKDGPLDMRMSSDGPSAADAVALLKEAELADIFYAYGEERASRRIARAVVRAREEAPIETTAQLARLVEKAIGGKHLKIHPATRVFQALRIFVNDELGELARGMRAAERLLQPLGRLVVVTFHSLEDRMVKAFLRARAGLSGGRGSRHAPELEKGPEPSFSLLSRKALAAGEAECARNPRARSAKLRAAVRTQAPAWDIPAEFSAKVVSIARLEAAL